MAHINIKKGHDLKLLGEPDKKLSLLNTPKQIKLHPHDFPGIKPKLLIKEGDIVLKGAPIFTDKIHPDIMFTSPIAGDVDKIIYGDRRRIESINITTSNQQDSIPYSPIRLDGLSELSHDMITDRLYKSGLWPCIRRRPFSKIAEPNKLPKAIFIPAMATASFGPNYNFIMEHDSSGFQAGINVLKQLADCDIHLVVDHKSDVLIFKEAENIILHTCTGPHPSGNVGVHIYHIDPIENKDDVVWYVAPQDVMSIGKLFLNGEPDYTKIITVGGSSLQKRQYYQMTRGSIISDILEDNLIDNDSRIISGDVLSGIRTNIDNALGFYHDILSVIPESSHREFLGWIKPGIDKYSLTRTFMSALKSRTEKRLTTLKNGSVRTMIPMGHLEKVTPIDVLTTPLIKAILSHDIDTMEKLGIYECAPEDFALCTFVDASKMNISTIIQEGLDIMDAEG